MIIYIRRQSSLWFIEKKQDILKIKDKMPNILVLKFQPNIDKEPVYIINSYNAPMRSKRAASSVDIIIEVPELLHKCVLIMRDFNLHYTNWDNCTINPTAQTKRFANWIANKNAIYELKVGTVTHARGGTLDFISASNSVSAQITECYVEPNLHITSDHKTILTCLEIGNLIPKKTS